MATTNGIKWEGIEEFNKILKDIPKQINDKGQQSALYKASKPIEDKARNYVKGWARGTQSGFSKMLLMAQNVKRVRYKGGVNIQIKNKVDIPVDGLKGRTHFSAYGWAKLIADGRQWTGKTTQERINRAPGGKKNQTRGKGDFIDMAFNKEARKSISIYKKIRVPMIRKAFDRSIKKYGIRS